MLSTRIPLGLLLIGVLVGLFYLDARLARWAADNVATGVEDGLGLALASGPILALLVAALVAAGATEFCRLAQACRHESPTVLVATFSVLLATCPWWAGPAGLPLEHVFPGLLAVALVVAVATHVLRGRVETATATLAVTALGVVYLGVLPSFLVRLRAESGPDGPWLLLMVVAVIKMGDVGAFFVGKFFGSMKLCPTISPGKTWEGLFGAILGATATALAFAHLGGTIDLAADGRNWLGLGQAFVFGPLVAVVGQIGDLGESLLKRNAGQKDSGQLLPEFGGVLDLLDSPLMVAPVAYYVLLVF